LSWFDWQSEMVVLNLEPVTSSQHPLLGIRKLCSGAFLLGLSIVAEYSCGVADRAEPIVAWNVTTQTMIRSQRETLETGNILSYSNSDADVNHPSELV